MKQQTLPPDYGVVHLDGEWYPIKIEKFYPREFLTLDPIFDDNINDAHFSRRQEAIEACLHHECEEARRKQIDWLRLAVTSNAYPDRCAHYVDEIQAITGKTPYISYDYGSCPYSSSTMVHVLTSWCPHCGAWQEGTRVYALTIDEALAQAAQEVYESRCRCQRIVEEHVQAVA